MKPSPRFQSLHLWALAAAVAAVLAGASTAMAGKAANAGDDYDRLDGKGASGKKVDVIEWEGNLEIHVYPGGSLKGLGLKLDKANKAKSVMVISYRFDGKTAGPLIRRVILGIDLREGFHAYKDTSVDEYDKIIISNNVLSEQVAEYKLDPEPSQLYPDGHPALAQAGKPSREPASSEKPKAVDGPERPEIDDHGTIKPFFSKQ